jgi:hypothetical protein
VFVTCIRHKARTYIQLSSQLACLPLLLQVSAHLLLNAEGQQYPIVYFDEFWLLRDKLLPMNDTLDSVPLHVTVTTKKFWWMQLQQQVGVGSSRLDGSAALLYGTLLVLIHASSHP